MRRHELDNTAVQNVVFDLDGTLVQSLEGIEESARVALSRVMPGEELPGLRSLIGPPLGQMFATLWPTLSSERLALLMAEYRAHYDSVGCLRSRPYPRVPEVLSHLHRTGMRLFVLTNKTITPAGKILAHLGLLALLGGVFSKY